MADSQVLSFLSGFSIALLGEQIRQRLFAPKLELTFGASPDFITDTPELYVMGVEARATYVRVQVRNKSFHLAKACRAYLTEVYRVDARGHLVPTEYCDSIQLSWAVRSDAEKFGPQDLSKGVPYFFDVVSFRDGEVTFRPHVAQTPFRYSNIFKGHGTYQFGIIVSGDGVKPARASIRVRWSGDLKALEATSMPLNDMKPTIWPNTLR